MIKILVSIVSLAMSSMSIANDIDWLKKLDIDGYIGYRYIYSSIDSAPVDSSPEIGMLINYEFNDNFSTFIQGNINNNVLESSWEHSIVYGILSYDDTISNIPFSVNIGKLRHDFGLYNDVISNPSTRPGIIAPQSIYWNNLAVTLLSGYGINLNVILGDFSLGYSIDEHIVVNELQESYMWSASPFVKIEPFFGSHQIVNLNYTPQNSNYIVKSSFSKLYLNKDIDSIEMITLGVKYDNSQYFASAETLIFKSGNIEWSDIDKLRVGYSVTLGYYFLNDLGVHINYNAYENSQFNSMFLDLGKDAEKWKDLSIGITKPIYNNFEFRFDVHHAWGGRTLEPSSFTKDNLTSWWYFGTSLVYNF